MPDDPYDIEGDDELFTQHRERGPRDERWQRPRVVSEFVRKAIENTVGSVQNTGTLSREALSYLLQQGDKGKKEVFRVVAHEVGEFLRNVDLSSEVLKVLTGLELEVKASVKFKPSKQGGLKTEVEHTSEVLSTRDLEQRRENTPLPNLRPSEPQEPVQTPRTGDLPPIDRDPSDDGV